MVVHTKINLLTSRKYEMYIKEYKHLQINICTEQQSCNMFFQAIMYDLKTVLENDE